MINSGKFLSSLAIATLLCALAVTTASGGGLKVDILRYEPSPVEIGQYFTVWVKIEDTGFGRADDLSIELVPLYPFSLDPKEEAIKNIGILPDDAALVEYHLYVDENAKPGEREIKVRYQDVKGAGWMNKSFYINIGSDTFNSKGTLKLQQIKTEPEVLMPGDTGVVTLTLQNTATLYSIELDGKDYNTNAKLRSASLLSTDDIKVTSGTDYETGTLGPGDTVNLTYNIEATKNAGDGTKHLKFKVTGSSQSYSYNWDIPIRVDSADIMVIPAKSLTLTNGKGTLEFDVANTHPNTLYSVSIRPVVDGIEFSPAEYFIGSIDHDELVTIEFDAKADSGNVSTAKNLTLAARYRSGNNLHTSSVDHLSLAIVSDKPQNNAGLASVGALFAVSAVSGIAMYWRKRRKK